jgi:uncharacterized membrane protein YbhN (UPF0104 family)
VTSVVVGVAVTAVLVAVVARHRDEFLTALSSATLGVILALAALQLVAVLTRTEAWHVAVEAAGGKVARRPLYRAASLGYLGSLLNAQLGTAARVAVLRKMHPDDSPRVPALIAAEVPIVVVEGLFGALASFTLIAPLGLPWWTPIVFFFVFIVVGEWLRRMARTKGDGWRAGLAVLRSPKGRAVTAGMMGIAITAQIARNWIALHAVGVDASVFDAMAVLIAIAVVAQLPIGPGIGAGATVLILGSEGVGAAAAAGVLLTATGALGTLTYVTGAALDGVRVRRREAAEPALETATDRGGRLGPRERPAAQEPARSPLEPVLGPQAGPAMLVNRD